MLSVKGHEILETVIPRRFELLIRISEAGRGNDLEMPSGFPLRRPRRREKYLKATAQGLVDVFHPTHRKVRDGWGTRLVVAGRNEIKAEADPLRDDNRKVCDGWHPAGRRGQ